MQKNIIKKFKECYFKSQLSLNKHFGHASNSFNVRSYFIMLIRWDFCAYEQARNKWTVLLVFLSPLKKIVNNTFKYIKLATLNLIKIIYLLPTIYL